MYGKNIVYRLLEASDYDQAYELSRKGAYWTYADVCSCMETGKPEELQPLLSLSDFEKPDKQDEWVRITVKSQTRNNYEAHFELYLQGGTENRPPGSIVSDMGLAITLAGFVGKDCASCYLEMGAEKVGGKWVTKYDPKNVEANGRVMSVAFMKLSLPEANRILTEVEATLTKHKPVTNAVYDPFDL